MEITALKKIPSPIAAYVSLPLMFIGMFVPPFAVLVILYLLIVVIVYRIGLAKHKKAVSIYLTGNDLVAAAFCQYVEGLPGLLPDTECLVNFGNDALTIQTITHNPTTAELPYIKIVNYGIYNHVDIKSHYVNKNKGVIGRGAVGGILFGSVGAVIGGMSGVGSGVQRVEERKNTKYLIINYEAGNGDIAVLSFIIEHKDNEANKRLFYSRDIMGTMHIQPRHIQL